MDLTDAVAVIVFAAVIAYAVFGGADFGSGIWDLTAGDAKSGGDARRLIDRAIGPVWEANHVWLIFIVVFLFTGFPDAFVLLMSTLYVPMSLAVMGVVVRGASFAFRKVAATTTEARVYGALFAASSLIAPFFFGTVAGAVASGRVDDDADRWSSWTGPTSLVGGVLAVLTCAFLAATFLTAEAHKSGRADLTVWFALRARLSGAAAGFVAIAAIPTLGADSPTLFDGLTGKALPLVLASAMAGAAALELLRRQHWDRARYAAAAAVASVVAGWGVAQYPWLLVDHVKIVDAAGARPTLWGLVVAFAIAAVLVLPSLAYLFWLTNNQTLTGHSDQSNA